MKSIYTPIYESKENKTNESAEIAGLRLRVQAIRARVVILRSS